MTLKNRLWAVRHLSGIVLVEAKTEKDALEICEEQLDSTLGPFVLVDRHLRKKTILFEKMLNRKPIKRGG